MPSNNENAEPSIKRLLGGTVVTPNEVLEDTDVIVTDDLITSIRPSGSSADQAGIGEQLIDCRGCYIFPGMIDIHSDYIEHMAAPRPGSIMDFSLALMETERELISHGITTMFHSLSFYKHSEFGENPIRNPENIGKFLSEIENSHRDNHFIRHRFHARFEIDTLERVEELMDYIRNKRIHLISFMDHTPGQGQYRDLETFRKTLKGYRNISDSEVDKIVQNHQQKDKLIFEDMKNIAELAHEMGIALASHDDDSVEKIALVHEMGATISEFPITLDVARSARSKGLHTIAGAPNILRGGSHSGNLSAEEAILDGSITILCSDYYPPALLHGIFYMYRSHQIPLNELVNLVSLHPAKAVGMDDQTGSIELGKKADLIIVNTIAKPNSVNPEYPVIKSAIVNGVQVYSANYRCDTGGLS
ncbi:MAG: phosphonate metabolism protein PhnM [Spirochaetaceae bacterium]|nr:MAG: phosphonate metabolism protein PhnM [Spirochaetaceae bacterium]